MLLHSYKITRVLPCLADPMKIRAIAEVSDEIHRVFPYLNAILKGCIYNHPANTLTIRKEQKLITLHAFHITLAKIEDEKEAEEVKADLLLTDCLSCKHNLRQGVPFEGKMRVMTTPEYLLEGIEVGKIQFSPKKA